MHLIVKRQPAWTIRGKQAQPVSKFSCPSPTSYSPNPQTLSNKQKAPKWKISLSTRKEGSKNQVPGPGAYQLRPLGHSQSAIIVGKTQTRITNADFPSPAHYQVKLDATKRSAPQISLSKRLQTAAQGLQVPGPGAYQVKSTQLVPPCSFGRSAKFVSPDQKNENPGPGNYEKSNRFSSRSEPEFSFPKSSRFSHAKLESLPGPYSAVNNFQQNVKSKKGYSLSSRHPLQSKEAVPGPGAYQVQRQSHSNSVIICGSKQTQLEEALKKSSMLPSPCSYNIKLPSNTRSVKFSTAKRQSFEMATAAVPGVGSYSSKTSLTAGRTPAAIILGRIQQKNQNCLPGPTNYNPSYKLIQKSASSYVISQDSRKTFQNANNFPGPLTYKVKYAEQSPKYSFRKEARNPLGSRQKGPGPAHYNIGTSFQKIK